MTRSCPALCAIGSVLTRTSLNQEYGRSARINLSLPPRVRGTDMAGHDEIARLRRFQDYAHLQDENTSRETGRTPPFHQRSRHASVTRRLSPSPNCLQDIKSRAKGTIFGTASPSAMIASISWIRCKDSRAALSIRTYTTRPPGWSGQSSRTTIPAMSTTTWSAASCPRGGRAVHSREGQRRRAGSAQGRKPRLESGDAALAVTVASDGNCGLTLPPAGVGERIARPATGTSTQSAS